MNDSVRNMLDSMISNLMLFMVLMVISYIAISSIVHKTPVFSKLGRSTKNAVVQLASVLAFGLLGYYFSGANFAAN